MKTRRCYIYTRVSTSMQVDGYSLDAQKDKLKKYAEFQDMVVAGEYSDEGKSGKNIEGRPQFLQMLKDIESGKDKVEFVLVFKLSRFGRNAADVLSSLQRMQDFGVNLICVEDGIDSSKDSGKLMISVLSAVAEIERENILVQTMEGRRQKAREGKWNGGFAPYGYKLVDGYLYIADDEVDVIRIIFDKYVNTTMGASAVATYLNEHGYVKKKRQNNTLDMFSAHFIKSILDNPVYCGKLAYGRRKNEKIAGTRNQYHIVKQDDYPVYDGVHEAIVSEEVWQMAQRKRQETGVKSEKIYNQEHENILSSILRCPVCGAAMYGNVNRKKKKDGTLYKDYYYYHCKHRTTVNGHKCGYRRQWKQEMVDAAVEEVIRKLVTNPKFEQAIRQKIGSRIDTEELETELEQLRKKLHQLNGAKAKLGQQMDSLDVTDKHYDRKYQDMEERLYKLYDDIDSVEEEIEEVETRIYNVRQQKISGDNIYQFLLYFDKLYDKFTDAEKKEFLNSFIERVDIYEQEQPDGRFLKHIKFRFPVYFNGKEIEEMSWDNETTVETWFTGREALEKGFADAIKEDEDDPEMSMSADRKVLFVNGVRHNVDGLQHVPGTIPVKAIATPPAAKPGANKKKPTTKAAKKEGGNKPMDEKELRAAYPEIVAQIEANARTEAQNTSSEAVAAERQRIEQIDSIAASIPDQQLVHDAKYGDNPCTAQELCFRVMQASAASGQNFLAAYQAEGAKSGAADVGAAPNGGTPASAQEQDAADIQAVVSAYNQTKGGMK